MNLLNNSKVTATHISRVKLNEKLLLDDVLYVSAFEYNLISIAKLVSGLNVEILFSSNLCVV